MTKVGKKRYDYTPSGRNSNAAVLKRRADAAKKAKAARLKAKKGKPSGPVKKKKTLGSITKSTTTTPTTKRTKLQKAKTAAGAVFMGVDTTPDTEIWINRLDNIDWRKRNAEARAAGNPRLAGDKLRREAEERAVRKARRRASSVKAALKRRKTGKQ